MIPSTRRLFEVLSAAYESSYLGEGRVASTSGFQHRTEEGRLKDVPMTHIGLEKFPPLVIDQGRNPLRHFLLLKFPIGSHIYWQHWAAQDGQTQKLV